MDRNQAATLAAELNAEAAEGNTGWTYAAVEADNHDRWAVAGQDEDGTPTQLWVTPELSFPTAF